MEMYRVLKKVPGPSTEEHPSPSNLCNNDSSCEWGDRQVLGGQGLSWLQR